MFGVPDAGLPIVHRVGGSDIYHARLDCPRLQRPSRAGTKKKRASPFDIEQAKALGWRPCAICKEE